MNEWKTTIIGFAILAVVAYGIYMDADKDVLFALIGGLSGIGLLAAKDAKSKKP